MHVNSLLLHQL